MTNATDWAEIRQQNRRAKIRLDPLTLGSLLDLPDGMYVQYVGTDHVGLPSIVVVVESPTLESQPHDVELPILAGSWSTETLYHAEPGSNDPPRAFIRWAWAPQTDEATG